METQVASKLEQHLGRLRHPFGVTLADGAPAPAACPQNEINRREARHRYQGLAGIYDIAVQYFDESDGVAKYALSVGSRQVDSWVADAQFGSTAPNGHTSTRRTAHRVTLAPGDEIRIEVTTMPPDGGAVDYIEIVPSDR